MAAGPGHWGAVADQAGQEDPEPSGGREPCADPEEQVVAAAAEEEQGHPGCHP
jgi:hypothetical protein